ncbi:hypothetical protein J591_0542 [Acinetobacter baumannii 532279]|nr:hypothetical protein J591_0542 [Acinetobacter baumannii 532279]
MLCEGKGLSVHSGIRHLEMCTLLDQHQQNVHGGIRHLEKFNIN